MWERTIKTIKGNIPPVHHSSVTPPMNGLGILLSDHLSPLLYKSKSPCWKCFHISLHRSRLVSYSCGWKKRKRWWEEVSSFHFRWYLHLWYEGAILRRISGAEKETCTKLSAQMLLSLLHKQDEGRVVVFLVWFTPQALFVVCLFAIPISLLLLFTHSVELVLQSGWVVPIMVSITTGKISDNQVELLLRGNWGNVWPWEDLG